MSSTSYSALIRRSKLATYSTGIDQVLSAHGAHLARSNFGLKRPLPKASTSAAPYVRVTRLDNAQKRTEFRKATKEALFLKKFSEAGVRVRATDGNNPGDIEDGGLQSRFITPGEPGSVGSAAPSPPRPPNFLAMPDDVFAAFLDGLEHRRDDFAAFVQEARSTNPDAEAGPIDLAEYAAAAKPAELIGHVEAFLARTSEPDPSTLPSAPQPHRTLALQYSHPTALESSFTPPIPGRLLGMDQASSYEKRAPRNLSSVMGLVSSGNASSTAGGAATTWFPDSTGVRSNTPGRASFSLSAEMHGSFLPVRMALSQQRGQKQFRPRSAAHEPEALAASVLRLNPTVVDGAVRPMPGSVAYSNLVPASPRRAGDLSELFFRAGGRQPVNLFDRPSGRARFLKTSERTAVQQTREQDGKLYRPAPKAKGRRATSDALTSLLDSLNATEEG
ncbi:hypothetical protein RQP46_000373 [Phenoliferia psychrophenolica]